MLIDFLKNVLENGTYPADVDEYLEYDDSKILVQIKEEAYKKPDFVKGAPYTQPVRRLDDVKAARELNLRYEPN